MADPSILKVIKAAEAAEAEAEAAEGESSTPSLQELRASLPTAAQQSILTKTAMLLAAPQVGNHTAAEDESEPSTPRFSSEPFQVKQYPLPRGRGGKRSKSQHHIVMNSLVKDAHAEEYGSRPASTSSSWKPTKYEWLQATRRKWIPDMVDAAGDGWKPTPLEMWTQLGANHLNLSFSVKPTAQTEPPSPAKTPPPNHPRYHHQYHHKRYTPPLHSPRSGSGASLSASYPATAASPQARGSVRSPVASGRRGPAALLPPEMLLPPIRAATAAAAIRTSSPPRTSASPRPSASGSPARPLVAGASEAMVLVPGSAPPPSKAAAERSPYEPKTMAIRDIYGAPAPPKKDARAQTPVDSRIKDLMASLDRQKGGWKSIRQSAGLQPRGDISFSGKFVPVPIILATWLRKRGKAVRPELTVQQRAQLKECFDLMDSDGSGAIDAAEMGQAFRFMGIRMSMKQIMEIIAEVDADGSGEVEYSEFVEIMTQTLGKDHTAPKAASPALHRSPSRARSPRSPSPPSSPEADDGTARSVHSAHSEADHAASSTLPFPLLATAYRRKKLLQAIYSGDEAMRKKMLDQTNKALADAEAEALAQKAAELSAKPNRRGGPKRTAVGRPSVFSLERS